MYGTYLLSDSLTSEKTQFFPFKNQNSNSIITDMKGQILQFSDSEGLRENYYYIHCFSKHNNNYLKSFHKCCAII